MREEEKHLKHYLILVLGIVIFMLFIAYFKYYNNVQILLSAGLSAFYCLWGIIHHAVEGRLSRLIFLEYILIGFLVFLLLFTALSI
ncbi:hypothetical protein A3F07_00730 [candidate division WWE3 bacterium RIFCSPHIGHO2_12_FULL_38_15]|uniref:Uncharacterized protein n=1 Tax=candidate division WWE3 bacterium RIFCSPHIGHO2_02_FULL_38_14 TaxID=1802620 RepID=A0A1F4VBQ8_UNCKA|nr:MAG: hypothetical protein A2793_00815 [candidate division WWE3 bacterium RIFCSPHIGHO2_01_FULL_38_45]OGC49099.1 MAG: hypothetical protein A3F07_00730 [candidate division WWE3 bacterium RIFCSPHIGHO2_12_FULL_38_15]OGC53554.1 MAG: hypothetical protein A3B64_04365 [candidate division WWE3 bacterium RIFCSPLOWO2_01_FULL_37_24]OGC54458.1 MAG: hypothetical protein A3D91_00995 [candidate division WWE3 bacterium RIFCSPHIGHO2_02_FULL_38_14]HLB51704.1 hypothetical protein [Patescibacteria group bacterium